MSEFNKTNLKPIVKTDSTEKINAKCVPSNFEAKRIANQNITSQIKQEKEKGKNDR